MRYIVKIFTMRERVATDALAVFYYPSPAPVET